MTYPRSALTLLASGLLAGTASAIPSSSSFGTKGPRAVANTTSEPCAVVSAAYASQIAAAPTATPTIAASVAHDCLLSVPLGKEAALEFVDSIEPYLEWQSGMNFPYPALNCTVWEE